VSADDKLEQGASDARLLPSLATGRAKPIGTSQAPMPISNYGHLQPFELARAFHDEIDQIPLVPAEAGIQMATSLLVNWIPAFAGTSGNKLKPDQKTL